MFRNNFPISRILGIGVIAIAVFIFTILYEELRNIYQHQDYYDQYDYQPEMETSHYIAIFASALVFLTGLGLILGYHWARILVILGLVGALSLWFIGVLLRNFNNTNERISMLGFTVTLVTVSVCIALLLYNKKVASEFGDSPVRNEFDDAMDSDLLDI